jgi:hypothetical protein
MDSGSAQKPLLIFLKCSVADPDPVLFRPLDPGMEKSGSGMNIPDHYSESLETIVRVKNILIL